MPPKGWKKNLSSNGEVQREGSPIKPTPEQIQEVIDPTLSEDSFKIGKQEFPIQILPISHEKKIALAVSPVLKQIESFINKDLGGILKETGGEVIVNIQDVLIDVTLIICKRYDASIERDFIEENATTKDLLSIVMAQLKKNKIGDLVSSFFFKVATITPPPVSQKNLGN